MYIDRKGWDIPEINISLNLAQEMNPELQTSISRTITFTTNLNGTYVLTMYGWCGDKKCDSCVIKFEVKCFECECKGSKWGEQTLTIDNVAQTFKCDKNKEIDVKCKNTFVVLIL